MEEPRVQQSRITPFEGFSLDIFDQDTPSVGSAVQSRHTRTPGESPVDSIFPVDQPRSKRIPDDAGFVPDVFVYGPLSIDFDKSNVRFPQNILVQPSNVGFLQILSFEAFPIQPVDVLISSL